MRNLPDDFVFSQSSLQDYVDCARRFDLRYIKGQRWPAPEVDDRLEFERRMQQGQQFHQLVHQHLIGLPTELLSKRIQDKDVQRWFEQYLRNGLHDVPEQSYPERTLNVLVGDYRLLAKFDLIAIGQDKALIIDWKTSRSLPRRKWLAKRLQTIVYRYVLAKGGQHLNNGVPIKPEKIEMQYWYAGHEGTTHRFAYGVDQFRADETYLVNLIHEIASRDTFSLTDERRRCRFCTYRSLCDRGREAGSLAEWELDDYDSDGLDTFNIDLEQIVEIEF